MAVSGVLMYSEMQVAGVDAEAALFAVIVLGVVLSELAGPILTMSLLSHAGELTQEARDADDRRRVRATERRATTPTAGNRDAGTPGGLD